MGKQKFKIWAQSLVAFFTMVMASPALADTLTLTGDQVGALLHASFSPVSPAPKATTASSCIVADVNVTFNATHTNDSDIDLSITSPGATTIVLSTDNGTTGNNYISTVFDDEAGTAITAGSPPFTGSFRPEGTLSSFDGQNTAGNWTLTLSDDTSNGETGNLGAWSVTITTATYYRDLDGDGYGDPDVSSSACPLPPGYVANNTDCDDANSAISPADPEICDVLDTDEDCDGLADEGDALGQSTWFSDMDGDGYGNSATTQSACNQPMFYVGNSTDCDDMNGARNPGAIEVCDVGSVDEDCDLLVDDNDPSASGETAWYTDGDSDGYGTGAADFKCDQPPGKASTNGDCNDGNGAISPGDPEICDVANTDEDCDGLTDNGDPSAIGESTWFADDDGDGFGDSTSQTSACDLPSGFVGNSTDCDDDDEDINPSEQEICDAGNVDEDCDLAADDADTAASGKTSWYTDSDGDGYGTGLATLACDQPSGKVATNGDCDDGNPGISPGDPEICDAGSVDEDCDGGADDADPDEDATGKTTWYEDLDSDTYGNPNETLIRCDQPAGYAANPAVCGDGVINTNGVDIEACDDGPNNSDTESDACRTTCVAASCGDGVPDLMTEECDEGLNNSDTVADACRTTCVDATCGDGAIDMDETCDNAGLNSDTVPNACRTNCAVATCGDGVPDMNEDCDNGVNNSDTLPNACRMTCADASCGDGVIDSMETCDDDDMLSEDGCSNICALEDRWVCSGLPSMCEPDIDDDGESDDDECMGDIPNCPDSDDDGFPDNEDAVDDDDGDGDSDGDGLSDNEECPNGVPCDDSDDDGIPDHLDNDLSPNFARLSGGSIGCSIDHARSRNNLTWLFGIFSALALLVISRRGARRRA